MYRIIIEYVSPYISQLKPCAQCVINESSLKDEELIFLNWKVNIKFWSAQDFHMTIAECYIGKLPKFLITSHTILFLSSFGVHSKRNPNELIFVGYTLTVNTIV